MKICSRCYVEKPESMFYKNHRYPDGHSPGCKECIKKYQTNRNRTTPIHLLLSNAKYRAKVNQIPFTLTEENINLPTHCPVFGIELSYGATGTSSKGHGANPNSASIDRIHPHKGYTPENAIVISLKANRGKNDMTIEEIIKLAEFYKQYL